MSSHAPLQTFNVSLSIHSAIHLDHTGNKLAAVYMT